MSIQDLIASLYAEFSQELQARVARQFSNLDAGLIEEACSHAWEQISARATLPPEPKAWLTRVAYNAAIALYNQRTGEVADAVAPDASHEFDTATHAALRAAIATLKPQQRVVLTLWADGYRYDEIAALTGQTGTWVNRHLAEGKDALRAIFRE